MRGTLRCTALGRRARPLSSVSPDVHRCRGRGGLRRVGEEMKDIEERRIRGRSVGGDERRVPRRGCVRLRRAERREGGKSKRLGNSEAAPHSGGRGDCRGRGSGHSGGTRERSGSNAATSAAAAQLPQTPRGSLLALRPRRPRAVRGVEILNQPHRAREDGDLVLLARPPRGADLRLE